MMSSREAAIRMVQRYRAANCNVLRFHSCPAPPHVLDVCDELGMLVIDESGIYASWQMLMPEHPGFMEACREHLRGGCVATATIRWWCSGRLRTRASTWACCRLRSWPSFGV